MKISKIHKCILLISLWLLPLVVTAQTPYDSFAPEATRPMIFTPAERWMQKVLSDSVAYTIAVDTQSRTLYLINEQTDSLVAIAHIDQKDVLWLSVDPLADKYIDNSPYVYCSGNPIMLVDPNGREITITGDDGMTVTYVPGGSYEGDDCFTKEMWSQLDMISNTKAGGIVVNELVNDDGKAFNLTSKVAKGPNGLDVQGYVVGSRQLRMGGKFEGAEALAHEFFHAYQDLHGYGGASCANDVEAYIFQGLVYGELYNELPFGMNATFQLQPIDNQSAYFNTYTDIMIDGILNIDRLNILANGFNVYSRAGANGVAKRYSTFSKNQQFRIIKFWH